MSWRGEEGGIAAAQQDHEVIMTPEKDVYFDYYQADPEKEPLAIGGLTTVEKVYGYEPIPSQLTAEQAKYVLGAQCNVWTEYLTTSEQVEYMVYPRALALSEVLWSPKAGKDYSDFVKRASEIRPLMDLWGINYAKHIFEVK
jgi:hexosaminidase